MEPPRFDALVTGQPEPAPGRALWAIVASSVALRLASAFLHGNAATALPGVADQVSYDALALRVLEGHGFSFATDWWPATAAGQPTAHWSYAYVIFLAGVYGIAGHAPLVARLLQALLVGLLQPVLAFRIGSRLFGTRAGLASAGVIAFYGYFVYYAGALMTESLCIVAILWSLAIALRIAEPGGSDAPGRSPRAWAMLGIALSMAVLLRQAMLFVVPVVLGWCAWHVFSAGRQRAGTRAAVLRAAAGATIVLVVLAAAIAPWTIRNRRAFGEFVLLNTNSGFAFFWGNHPIHGTSFVPILPGEGAYGALIPDEVRSLNEARLERELLKRGVGFVVADPWRYVRLSLTRAVEFLKFWPSPGSATLSNVVRVCSFGLLLPLVVAGVWLAFGRRGSRAATSTARCLGDGRWLLVGVAAVYSLLHLLTWTLVRYRLPVDAVLVPFVGLAVATGLRHLQRARVSSSGVLRARAHPTARSRLATGHSHPQTPV